LLAFFNTGSVGGRAALDAYLGIYPGSNTHVVMVFGGLVFFRVVPIKTVVSPLQTEVDRVIVRTTSSVVPQKFEADDGAVSIGKISAHNFGVDHLKPRACERHVLDA